MIGDKKRLTVFFSFEVELWRSGRHWAGVVAAEEMLRAGHKGYLFCRPLYDNNPTFDYLRSLGAKIIIPKQLLRQSGLVVRYAAKALLLPSLSILKGQDWRRTRHQLASFDGRFLELLWLRRTLSQCASLERPDILHAFGATRWTATGLEWAHVHKVPVVYTETGEIRYDTAAHNILTNTIVKDSAAITVPGHRLADGIRRHNYGGELRVIPFGVRGPEGLTLGDSNGQKGSITIGCAARYDILKGLNFLIDAVVQLRTEFPRVRLRLAGEGNEYRSLVNQVRQLGISESVEFAEPYRVEEGWERFMTGIDIYCLPSLTEGQPISVIEAMAYGKPIVATDVGSVAEMLAEGAGIIVKPRDVSSLTQALALLLRDRELREKMGSNARETYLRKHRAEIVGLAHLELYQQLLKT